MKIKVFSSPLSCILKCIRFLLTVINKKIILAVTLLVFLSGCIQNTALLGPAYTFGSSGSVLQTGLSYGSNKIYTEYKDKELQKTIKNDKRIHELKNLLKAQITKTRKKLRITN